jgi:hypothetical protein
MNFNDKPHQREKNSKFNTPHDSLLDYDEVDDIEEDVVDQENVVEESSRLELIRDPRNLLKMKFVFRAEVEQETLVQDELE